jgi:hypothetical protein
MNMQNRVSSPKPLVSLVAALVLAGSSPARAESEPPPEADFTGVWVYAADEQEVKERREAIEAAIDGVPRFARGKAKKRLGERTTPPPELEIEVAAGHLELSRGDRDVSLQLDGDPVTFEKDGKRAALSAQLIDGQIVVTSKGDNGTRVTTYRLSPDRKQLILSVNMQGARLSEPVVYQTTYVRR